MIEIKIANQGIILTVVPVDRLYPLPPPFPLIGTQKNTKIS